MAYHLDALEASLAGTPFAGQLRFVPSTTSTNNDAMAAAAAGAAHGATFFADEQTAGRGRGDHRWHSAAGQGLYVSVVLRPQIAARQLSLLSLAAGLATAQAVSEICHVALDLRWPNDLLHDGSKLGGILVESKLAAQAVAYAVVGIGINVHQQQFAPDLATPATSLDRVTGQRQSRQQLLVALLKSLQREAQALEDAALCAALPRRLARHSSWIEGRAVDVHGPQACTGITEGLDAQGFLRVRTATGLVTVQTGGLRAAHQD